MAYWAVSAYSALGGMSGLLQCLTRVSLVVAAKKNKKVEICTYSQGKVLGGQAGVICKLLWPQPYVSYLVLHEDEP